MPKFFFDLIDGTGCYCDENGLDCSDLATAGSVALSALPDLVLRRGFDGKRRAYAIEIRESCRHEKTKARLSIKLETKVIPAKLPSYNPKRAEDVAKEPFV